LNLKREKDRTKAKIAQARGEERKRRTGVGNDSNLSSREDGEKDQANNSLSWSRGKRTMAKTT
jgi:hypothetical protein